MAKGVFMTAVTPAYDDLPEIRYHFPKRYLGIATKCLNDWILYYEPRMGGGRMSYFATARVTAIRPDPNLADHFYADIQDFLEFPMAVPYRDGDVFHESSLRKADGSANKGRLGWALHLIPENEFNTILQLGMMPALDEMPDANAANEPETDYGRILTSSLVTRPCRDRAFAKSIRQTYQDTCAFTGIKLVNGGGRCEIEAAHIRPVEDHGPDSLRNGLALSRTVHWMFDRGILSLEDDGKILEAKGLVPDAVKRLLNPDRQILLPVNSASRPHPQFLRYHREHRFKG